ncbi:S-adenosyl-L-methionine-dependent methyltransferase [Pseudovirgaria hyperparasitica]|uniref:S-adenosyl-L-methionine-dependent methyltransferase n=1 Tax=Pseudovirgaria hyperparasitica TaxID=470096 RepID=A0A6A6W252_9PEZI|nr:S-adenosyl-L-methionine-dependent methyltransferase [Pseudovirgaria hyperparasitica]KAF2756126.1 S-adenosyl-L-methionine-dependent methyltransferase [Pseudovirgaria hyperparasitica]
MANARLDLDTDQLAQNYEEINKIYQFQSGKMLVDKLGDLTGLRILDLGCGTGTLTIHFAKLVGPTGSVSGTEPLAKRVALGNETIAAENKKRKDESKHELHVSLAVGTAENAVGMFPAGSFDIICMNSVFHWVQDQAAALAGIRKLLNESGRLAICGSSKEHYHPQSEKNRVLAGERYREHVPGGIARLSTRSTLHSLLQDANLLSRTIDLVPYEVTFPNYDKLMEFEMASTFGNFLDFRFLPENLRKPAELEVIEAYRALDKGAGIPMTVTLLMTIAKKF